MMRSAEGNSDRLARARVGPRLQEIRTGRSETEEARDSPLDVRSGDPAGTVLLS